MAQELVPNDISPFTADVFLAQLLGTHSGLDTLVDGRIKPALDGFEPSEFLEAGAAPELAWPYVLFGEDGDAQFQVYSSDLTLQTGQFLVRAFMREDIALARGLQFEDVAARCFMQILNAVQGHFWVPITGEWGGTVHECQLLPQRHRVTYGEKPRRVCEMGVRVRITTT